MFVMKWVDDSKPWWKRHTQTRVFKCAGGWEMAKAWAMAWCVKRGLRFTGLREVEASR